MGEDDQDGFDLSSDDFVDDVLQGSDVPPDVIKLEGYLGTSGAAGYHRLFTDAALRSWVDIPRADIVYREQTGDGNYGQPSTVWVTRTAVLLKGRLITAEEESRFLIGDCGEEIPCPPPGCDCTPAIGHPKRLWHRGGSYNASRSGPACC